MMQYLKNRLVASLTPCRLLALWLMLLMIAPTASAQGGDLPSATLKPAIRFSHFTADSGLAQNNVNAILQDGQGFMWIGTNEGLSRFDGYTFTTYKHDPENPHSLSHNHIQDIFEDRDGMLWIATRGGGINRFDPMSQRFSQLRHNPDNPNSLGDDQVFSVFQDKAGIFWFGGPFMGINRYDPLNQTFTRYPSDPNAPTPFPGGGVWETVEDEQGMLWLAADFALVKLDPRSEQFTAYPVGNKERRLAALHLDADGNVWGGGFAGLYRFTPQTEQFTFYKLSGPMRLNDILADENGALWLAGHPNGLLRFDPVSEQFTRQYLPDQTDPYSISDDRLETLYRDRGGVLWIGLVDRGLSLLDPRQSRFSHFRHVANRPNSLADVNVRSISGDDQGHLWVGTGAILNKIDLAAGTVEHFTPPLPREDAGTLQATYRDSAGIIWLGATPNWLIRFDPATQNFTSYAMTPETATPALPVEAVSPPPDSPRAGAPPRPQGPPTHPTAIIEDRSGALWIAVQRGGLYRFDPSDESLQLYHLPRPNRTNLDDPQNIASTEIRSLATDHEGNIWLGYTRDALSRLDPDGGIFTHFQPGVSLIEAIYPDQGGKLWLATDGGLVHFDPQSNRSTTFTEKDGLPGNAIVSMLEDKTGNLWLGTRRGLSRFDPEGKTFRNYDVSDGLQGNEFIARAAWQTPQGEMVFGGKNGLNIFSPDQIEDVPSFPATRSADRFTAGQQADTGR